MQIQSCSFCSFEGIVFTHTDHCTYNILFREILYASHETETVQKQFLDAQVKVNQVMTIALFVHLITISFTRGIVKQIWVFVREIVIEILIVLQDCPVSSGENSTWCLGAKARGHEAKTIAFPKQPCHLQNR